jgi:large subunit ribosomal protein L24
VKTVLRSDNKVIIEGINRVRRHLRPSPANPDGFMDKDLPIHVSNVAVVDPVTGLPTKVGFKFLDDGTKVRFAKRSGEVLSNR